MKKLFALFAITTLCAAGDFNFTHTYDGQVSNESFSLLFPGSYITEDSEDDGDHDLDCDIDGRSFSFYATPLEADINTDLDREYMQAKMLQILSEVALIKSSKQSHDNPSIFDVILQDLESGDIAYLRMIISDHALYTLTTSVAEDEEENRQLFELLERDHEQFIETFKIKELIEPVAILAAH